MTVGQACGFLLESHLDKHKLTATERREILRMIPPHCRFVDPKTHKIAVWDTIAAVIELHRDVRGEEI